jgi:spermidine/putrescine-binding protein
LEAPQEFGFGFKKTKDNPLIKGFNEFLEKIDKEKLFEKWNVDNTFNINLEKNNFNKVYMMTQSFT